jgi:hypothetical protein
MIMQNVFGQGGSGRKYIVNGEVIAFYDRFMRTLFLVKNNRHYHGVSETKATRIVQQVLAQRER